jgi:hypothetical protein
VTCFTMIGFFSDSIYSEKINRFCGSDSLVPIYISGQQDGERRGGSILLSVGAIKLRELYLPLGWILRNYGVGASFQL